VHLRCGSATNPAFLVVCVLCVAGATISRAAPRPRLSSTVSAGRCNVGMPNNVFDRFLWVIKLYAQGGFKVVIDNHVWLEDPTGNTDCKQPLHESRPLLTQPSGFELEEVMLASNSLFLVSVSWLVPAIQSGAMQPSPWMCFCVFVLLVAAYEDPKAWVAGWVRLASAISKVGAGLPWSIDSMPGRGWRWGWGTAVGSGGGGGGVKRRQQEGVRDGA